MRESWQQLRPVFKISLLNSRASRPTILCRFYKMLPWTIQRSTVRFADENFDLPLNELRAEREGRPPQGALFAFELLSERLGRLFEPFVIQILPFLLNSCGDGDENVREAAELAARTVMSQVGKGMKRNSFCPLYSACSHDKS